VATQRGERRQQRQQCFTPSTNAFVCISVGDSVTSPALAGHVQWCPSMPTNQDVSSRSFSPSRERHEGAGSVASASSPFERGGRVLQCPRGSSTESGEHTLRGRALHIDMKDWLSFHNEPATLQRCRGGSTRLQLLLCLSRDDGRIVGTWGCTVDGERASVA
jgi:hypothetical protein